MKKKIKHLLVVFLILIIFSSMVIIPALVIIWIKPLLMFVLPWGCLIMTVLAASMMIDFIKSREGKSIPPTFVVKLWGCLVINTIYMFVIRW